MEMSFIFHTEYAAGATITLGFDPAERDVDNKIIVHYSIQLPFVHFVKESENAYERSQAYRNNDLRVVPKTTDEETMSEAVKAFFSFLSACAESGDDGENSDLFPKEVRLWAEQNVDDITMLSLEEDEQLFL